MRAPGPVVEADHRDPGGGGQVHHLVDLLGEDLAERAAEDGEVLAEDADPAPVDGAEAGHDAVGVGPVVLQPHAVGPVPGQHVELLERALVEQVLDALPGGQLALGVLALDRPRASGVQGLVLAFGQVGQAFGHGVFHVAEANAPGEGPEIGTARRQCRRGASFPPVKPGQARGKTGSPPGPRRRRRTAAAHSPKTMHKVVDSSWILCRRRRKGNLRAWIRAAAIVRAPGNRYNSLPAMCGFGRRASASTWDHIFSIER